MEMKQKNLNFLRSTRQHIGLITNHGYGGVKLPLGGAPDTGGQNFYVNSLAETMERLGYKVTIFTRGGFPFFNSKKLRKGVEFLSDFVRYVYVIGGPSIFIPKEDIGYILDEEVDWLYNFLNNEAKICKTKPYNLFLFINSHYWDGAIITIRLIQRWQNDLLFELLKKDKNLSEKKVFKYYYTNRHKFNVYSSPSAIIGNIILNILPDKIINLDNIKIKGMDTLISKTKRLPKHLQDAFFVQKIGEHYLKSKPEYNDYLKSINRHLWTPHSLGIIKMRNYWEKDVEIKRKLKFSERISYEYYICQKTPFIAATSEEIVKSLNFYYNYQLKRILFFPPCIDSRRFKARKKDECKKAYKYLSKVTGIKEETLKTQKIVFETSRMDFTKRKDILIKSFKYVVRSIPEAILIIGGGPENNVFKQLRSLIQQEKLSGRAFLTGFIPQKELEEIFSIADVFVTSSEMEGFGITASQAAASLTPIVSSNLVPFCVYYLKENAIIVNAGDIKGFAKGIIRILKDYNFAKKIAEEGKKISEQFNWEKKTAEIIKFMQKNLSFYQQNFLVGD